METGTYCTFPGFLVHFLFQLINAKASENPSFFKELDHLKWQMTKLQCVLISYTSPQER